MQDSSFIRCGLTACFVFVQAALLYAQSPQKPVKPLVKSLTAEQLRSQVEQYLGTGQLDSALQYIKQSLSIVNNDTISMEAEWNKGRIYGRKGETVQMFDAFFRALDLAEKLKNYRKIVLYCNSIGSMYVQYNILENAEEYLRRAKKIAAESNDALLTAQVETEISELRAKQGDYDAMRIACMKALDLTRTLPVSPENPEYYYTAAHLHNKLGWAFIGLGRYSEAIPYLDTALGMYAQTPIKRFIPDVYIAYARAFIRTGKKDAALDYIRLAEEFSNKMNINIIKIVLYSTASEVQDSLGNFQAGYAYYRRSVEAERSIFSSEAAARTDVIKQGYEDRLHREQDKFQRNLLLFGLASTLIALAITLYFFRAKSRTAWLLREQQILLTEQSEQIQQTNAQLLMKNDELERLNTLKNEFLGMAAHDLRNPLHQIIFATDTLQQHLSVNQNTVGENKAHTFTKRVISAAEAMNQILQDLLDVNKIESGKLKLEPQFLSSSYIQNLVEGFQDLAARKSITLHYEDTTSADTRFYADSRALRQVMDNLLSNAVKYSPRQKQVFVRFINNQVTNNQAAHAYIRLEVQDQGPGFTETDKTRLFQKFARLTAKPTGDETSTGLGLAITKSLVEAMSGKIVCESTLGDGATFIVWLPRQKP